MFNHEIHEPHEKHDGFLQKSRKDAKNSCAWVTCRPIAAFPENRKPKVDYPRKKSRVIARGLSSVPSDTLELYRSPMATVLPSSTSTKFQSASISMLVSSE